MANCFFLALVLGVFSLTALVLSQDQSGFISIDCGISEDSSYKDQTTSINYASDSEFIDTGINQNISPQYKKNTLAQQFWNVRSFPEGSKNCYTLNPVKGKGNNYLIRAQFMYGNYDAKGQIPDFDLYLGVNKWGSVKLKDASSILTKEMIHVLSSDYMHVCLVNTGKGTPFLSALELRLLHNNTYVTESGSLELFDRLDCGLDEVETVRFPDDIYDRIWSPFNAKFWEVLSTSFEVKAGNDFQPASKVMTTAVTTLNGSRDLGFSSESDDPNSQFYIYMHVAEIKKLQANESREFKITLNEELPYGPVVPAYLDTTTVYSTMARKSSKLQVWLNQTENSTLPPLINAIEIFTVKNLQDLDTDQKEVEAIGNIKSIYGVKRNWQGDPCQPKAYSWEGLNCSYDPYDPPRIISLNLSSSGLTGEIASSISNLTMLQYLDLSYNSLTGTLPNFLSQLAFLKVLNLEGNKLSGSVPTELIEKSNKGTLFLSVGKNQNLCSSLSCKKKKKVLVPVVASVGGFVFLLLVAAVAIFWSLQMRKRETNTRKLNPESNQKDETSSELSRKRQFSYSDILTITNNFERVLGKGGFGTVYHGYLDDIQVAVKMLSPSSIQGYKQFQAEAKLLVRVHHRNLTTLVGYCDDGTHLGLMYEFMENGNLKNILSEKNPHCLSWEKRLRIALNTAQGLEYLHNGCKPPIIHRDVKSTNILLDAKFEAKLADFGMSRIFPAEGGTHVSTVVAGTPGYLDPEYFITNRLNEKSDVFSYGVVLLEIITSRPSVDKSPERTHVVEWVSFMLAKGDIQNVVDPRLQGDVSMNSVWKAVELAMACGSSSSIKRPNMTHVVMELNQCLTMEIARKNESIEGESKEVIEMVTMNPNPPLNPLPR